MASEASFKIEVGFSNVAKADSAEAAGDVGQAKELLVAAVEAFLHAVPHLPAKHQAVIKQNVKGLLTRAEGLKRLQAVAEAKHGAPARSTAGDWVALPSTTTTPTAVPTATPLAVPSASSASQTPPPAGSYCTACGSSLEATLFSKLGVTAAPSRGKQCQRCAKWFCAKCFTTGTTVNTKCPKCHVLEREERIAELEQQLQLQVRSRDRHEQDASEARRLLGAVEEQLEHAAAVAPAARGPLDLSLVTIFGTKSPFPRAMLHSHAFKGGHAGVFPPGALDICWVPSAAPECPGGRACLPPRLPAGEDGKHHAGGSSPSLFAVHLQLRNAAEGQRLAKAVAALPSSAVLQPVRALHFESESASASGSGGGKTRGADDVQCTVIVEVEDVDGGGRGAVAPRCCLLTQWLAGTTAGGGGTKASEGKGDDGDDGKAMAAAAGNVTRAGHPQWHVQSLFRQLLTALNVLHASSVYNSLDPCSCLVELTAGPAARAGAAGAAGGDAPDAGPLLRVCGLGTPGALPDGVAAPEVLDGSSQPDVRSDMWSFGALLLWAYSGRAPVIEPGRPGVSVHIDQCCGNERVRSLLASLLVVDARHRPTAAQAIRSPYFNTSLIADLQRTGALVEYDRKREALQECINGIKDSDRRFRFSVRRAHLLDDVIKAFSKASAADLRRLPSVTFEGEAGVDAGGLTNEMYEQFWTRLGEDARKASASGGGEGKEGKEGDDGGAAMALFEVAASGRRECFLPRALPPAARRESLHAHLPGESWECQRCTLRNAMARRTCEACRWANPDLPAGQAAEGLTDPCLKYEAIGRIMAKMIFDGRRCPIHLSSAMVKYLLGRSLGMEDLAAWDSQVARSCYDILEKDVTGWGLDWDDVVGDDSTEQQGGLELSEDNKREFVQAKIEQVLVRSRAEPLAALRRGFNASPIAANLKLFSAPELDAVLCGEQAINAESLIAVTRFRGFPRGSQVPMEFKAFLRGLAASDLRRFLVFVTSQSSLTDEVG